MANNHAINPHRRIQDANSFFDAATPGAGNDDDFEAPLRDLEQQINEKIAQASSEDGEAISAQAARFTLSMTTVGATVMVVFKGK